jgi:hypothetical protein
MDVVLILSGTRVAAVRERQGVPVRKKGFRKDRLDGPFERQEMTVGLGGRGGVIWLGMVLGGLALAAYVALSWPEPTFRLVRLPYGESMPKTPAPALAKRQVTAAAPKAEPGRSLAGAAPTAPASDTAGEESPLLERVIELPPLAPPVGAR